MIICVPVTADGLVEPRWGRAPRVAIAHVEHGSVGRWEETDVNWDRLHDEGGEGVHHARVARFLRERNVDAVLAEHMGPGMEVMLARMGITVWLGAAGDARSAVAARAGATEPAG